MIEGGQRLVALEVVVVDAGFGAVDAEHRLGVGVVARERSLEQRVAGADVVEDAIEHQVDAAFLAGAGQPIKGGIVAQAGVDAEEIHGVVAVALGLEDGPQGQAVGAQFDEVVEPRQQAVQSGRQRPFLGRGTYGCTGKAQGVDMPPDGVIDPAGHGASSLKVGRGARNVPVYSRWQDPPGMPGRVRPALSADPQPPAHSSTASSCGRMMRMNITSG